MPVLPSFDCCEASECDSSSSVQIPGPAGASGADGSDGSDGISAFTTTTGSFTMPAELANITVDVVTSAPFTPNQIIFIQVGGAQGYFSVVSKPSATQIFVKNLEDTPNGNYESNSSAGTIFASGATVSPAGPQGPSGAGGSGGGAGLYGSGNPEGVTAANPGTTYWDTTNFIFYIKNAGTDEFGWRELIS